MALCTILARMEGAVVDGLALGAAESRWTGTRVVVERAKEAGSAVLARRSVARVRYRDLTEGRREAKWARTREARHRVRQHLHSARAAILASWSRSSDARIGELTVLAHILRWTTAVRFTALIRDARRSIFARIR